MNWIHVAQLSQLGYDFHFESSLLAFAVLQSACRQTVIEVCSWDLMMDAWLFTVYTPNTNLPVEKINLPDTTNYKPPNCSLYPPAISLSPIAYRTGLLLKLFNKKQWDPKHHAFIPYWFKAKWLNNFHALFRHLNWIHITDCQQLSEDDLLRETVIETTHSLAAFDVHLFIFFNWICSEFGNSKLLIWH